MKRKLLYAALLAALLPVAGTTAHAADQDRNRDQERVPAQDQEPIYGSQLMTRQEQLEYRNRMRNAKTPEEREQIRAEHHEQMKARARERGVTLPDEPPARGRGGMGPGRGMGPGGGGMGPGMGNGRRY